MLKHTGVSQAAPEASLRGAVEEAIIQCYKPTEPAVSFPEWEALIDLVIQYDLNLPRAESVQRTAKSACHAKP
jgi:hypothetical protein